MHHRREKETADGVHHRREKKRADGLHHRPSDPWHRNNPEGLFRCSVVSSIVKHQRSAIDPVILVRWLYAAPTQEEGQSSIPANSRPTIEPVEGRIVFKDLDRTRIETSAFRVLRNEDSMLFPCRSELRDAASECQHHFSHPQPNASVDRPQMAGFPKENSSPASKRRRRAAVAHPFRDQPNPPRPAPLSIGRSDLVLDLRLGQLGLQLGHRFLAQRGVG